MNSKITQRLLKFTDLNDIGKKENAVKEVLQEIILYALSKTDFFSYATFYGGTALRIFYNLDRYSEDLDFSLYNPNKEFKLENYFASIKEIMAEFGIECVIQWKEKSFATLVDSAF